MKLVHLGLLASALLLAACNGDDGIDGKNGADGKDGAGEIADSLNGITPSRAFPGRTVTLTISGDNTVWESAPSVSFDDAAITVKNVEVASPTALLVEIELGESAAIGSKTITVGDNAFKGFQVVEAVSGTVLGGTEQGALAFLSLRNNDSENLFSTYTDSDDLPAGIQLGNAGAGVYAGLQSVEAQSAEALLLIDADAAATERSVAITGIDGVSFGAAKFTVVARAAEDLNASLTGVAIPALGSKLYKVSVPADGETTQFALEATGADSVALINLGADGSWDNANLSGLSAAASVVVEPGNSVFFAAINLGAAATVGLDVTATELNSEVEPNDTLAQANTLALATSVYAKLSSDTDIDLFKITLTESKKIKAATTMVTTETVQGFFGPTQVGVDNIVRILDSAGVEIANSGDDAYAETVTTAAAQPAGDYYVEVVASDYQPVEAPLNDYILRVTAE